MQMIMGLKFLIPRSGSGTMSNDQPIVCDEEETSSTIDFTVPAIERSKLIEDLRKGNVSKLRMFTNDIGVLRENSNYLTESLLDLNIRPEPAEYLSDDEEAEEDENNDIQSSQIHLFPRAFETFCNIQTFYLDNNGVYPANLLMHLQKLENLERVTLCHCGIDGFSYSLCKKIKYLNLARNSLTSIPASVFELEFLQCLIVTRNKISEIDVDVTRLCHLEKLDISHNKLYNFAVSFCKLPQLLKLYLSGNKIRLLPNEISLLKHLKQLDLSNNCLTSLPDSIGSLPRLKLLNLNYNKLTAVPESICDLCIGDDGLLLSGNPLYKPPIEVCIEGKDSIRGYFDAARESLGISCKRLKLVLLGESFAGKTSLAKALVEGKDGKVKDEYRTVGLDFYSWKPDPLNTNLQVVLVDCAGQRKYLLTHQFFFSEGAVFLLVVDLEKYEKTDECFMTMIGEWISLVTGQVPGAVIFIVPTHLDRFSNRDSVDTKCLHIVRSIKEQEEEKIKVLDAEINQSDTIDKLLYLRRKRPYLSTSFVSQIPEESTHESVIELHGETEDDMTVHKLCMIPVSCVGELENLSRLRMAIQQIFNDKELCPILEKEIPQIWMDFEVKIKSLLTKIYIPVMTVNSLIEIAEKEFQLTHNMTLSALNYFNSIGSIAYFKNVEKAKHLVFLDLSWLVGKLQLLFRHDHEINLMYTNKFMKFGVMEAEFQQDKDQLLRSGNLSRNLLRCIWSDIGHDVILMERIVDILEHFSIICRIKGGDYDYFITWFLADCMSSVVEQVWSKYDSKVEDQIITRVDVGISVLPTSVFERFLILVRANSRICSPWKTGFFVREDASNIRITCNVENGANCSQVTLHGRFLKGSEKEMWIILCNLWKKFQLLISEWNGLVCRKSFSVCPKCIEEGIKKPYIFPINWLEFKQSNVDARECLKCYNFVDDILLKPSSAIIKELVLADRRTSPADTPLTGPLSDLEISTVAEMIGNDYARLAMNLGLQQYHVEAAVHNWPHDHYRTALELLNEWRKIVVENDRDTLVDALKNLGPSRIKIVHLLTTGRKESTTGD